MVSGFGCEVDLMAWKDCCLVRVAGCLFITGQIYHHKAKGSFVVSMGFQKYCAAALPLLRTKIGEKAGLPKQF